MCATELACFLLFTQLYTWFILNCPASYVKQATKALESCEVYMDS